jgi:hypothetical protein
MHFMTANKPALTTRAPLFTMNIPDW